MTEEYISQFENAVIYHRKECDGRCVYLRYGKPWEIATDSTISEVDNIYRAKITMLAPSLGGAFADIGAEKKVLIEGCTLQVGESVIVQIKQDRYAEKEYKGTTNICIRKGAVLYFPCDNSGKAIRENNNIGTLAELNRLAKENGGRFSLKGYYKKVDQNILLKEGKACISYWNEIKVKYSELKKPSLLFDSGKESDKLLLNHLGDADILFTNDENIARLTKEEFNFVEVRLIDEKELFNLSFLDREIVSIMDKKIMFKNGSIVFDYTEAFTAVDVNSEGNIGKLTEKPWLTTNLTACAEIARQLCLRNIGGAVVIDFISMDSQEDKNALLDELCSQTVNSQNVRVFKSFTHLGHVELTRKRSGERKDNIFLTNGEDNGLRDYFSLYRDLRELKERIPIREVTLYLSNKLNTIIKSIPLSKRLESLKLSFNYEIVQEDGYYYRIQI